MLYPRLQRFILHTHAKRATFEVLFIGVAVWAYLFFLQIFAFSQKWEFDFLVAPIIFTVNPLCLLFYALRLQMPSKLMSWQSAWHLALSLLVNLALCALGWWLILLVVPARSLPIPPFTGQIVYGVFTYVINYGWFTFVRVALRVILLLNQLRRKYLLWGLAYAHMMVVLVGVGLLILIVEGGALYSARPLTEFTLVPLLFLLLGLGAIPLVAVVPPSVLFSYFVMRRTIQRIQTLAVATSTLREGDYTIRVPVVGEDEVAQLQSNFNGMAADLEHAMQALQGERDRVASLLQERRELIANVSHELRTPVATLRGYLETTLMHWDDIAPVTLHHDVQGMENELLQLQTRVDELFTLARAELGELKLQCEPVDIGKLVFQIVEGNAPLAWRSSKIEIVADIAPALPLVHADPQRLEQAILNLLHNALHHTSPGGIVALTVLGEPDVLALHVKDTGEGIAPQDLPHIWKRFYQTERTRVHHGGGTGLGLALVKEWVETMGGSVAVESTLDEGSCFTIRLLQSR